MRLWSRKFCKKNKNKTFVFFNKNYNRYALAKNSEVMVSLAASLVGALQTFLCFFHADFWHSDNFINEHDDDLVREVLIQQIAAF